MLHACGWGPGRAYRLVLTPVSPSAQAAATREAELVRVADKSKTALTKLEQNALNVRREVRPYCRDARYAHALERLSV